MKSFPRLMMMLAVGLALSACGTGVSGVQQAVGFQHGQESVSGLGRIDPARYEPLTFETLKKMHNEPDGALRQGLVGKRVQVKCLAEYVIPGNQYTGIRIVLFSVGNRQDYIRPINVTPGLFYFQSWDKKEAWLKERGFVEYVYNSNQELSPVTLFAQVLPSSKDRNSSWPWILNCVAVRRADGKILSL